MADGDDTDALLRPRRERLLEARVIAAKLGLVDAGQFWEALACADLIPMAAVDDPRRLFAGPETLVQIPARAGEVSVWGLTSVVGHDLYRHPATVADAVALAADWPRVLTAEEIAREVLRVDRVVWRVEHREEIRARISDENLRGRQRAWLGERGASDLLALGYAVDGDGLDARYRAFVKLLCPSL